jgi:membrane fusion protein, protease secretion system
MSNLEFERKNLMAENSQEAVDVNDRRPSRWGLALVLAGFGGFVLWAVLAPLDSGVVANATANVTDNRKTIQHLDGGSIKSIAVREGQMVEHGQTLVELDATRAIAEQGVVSGQYIVLKSVENRLQAERDGMPEVTFDPALLERFAGDPRLNASIALQRRLFTTRRAALTGEAGILEETIRGAEEQVFIARRDLLEAKLRYLVSRLQLAAAVGLLGDDDIRQANAYLGPELTLNY